MDKQVKEPVVIGRNSIAYCPSCGAKMGVNKK